MIAFIFLRRFPKKDNLKREWICNMKIKNFQPTRRSVLCSKHFEEHFIATSNVRTRLCYNAIPTIFREYPNDNRVCHRFIDSVR